MSGKTLKWAWELELPLTQKLVMIALAYHADDDGLAWPSNRKLRAKTGLSRTGLILQVRKLEVRGLIVRQLSYRDNGAQTSNRYQLGVHLTETPPVHDEWTPPIHLYVEGEGTTTGGPHDIQYEIQEEIHSIGGEPQEDEGLNIDEVLAQHVALTREDIFSKALRKDDKLTPDGCAYLWRNCRSSAGDNGFQAELMVKDKKMLHSAYKRVGEDYNLAVWSVMSDWIGFTKAAESGQGAFSLPSNPQVSFFIKYIETAVDFMSSNSFSDSGGFVQLAANSSKPLTKPSVSKDNTSEAITSGELAAIGEEL